MHALAPFNNELAVGSSILKMISSDVINSNSMSHIFNLGLLQKLHHRESRHPKEATGHIN